MIKAEVLHDLNRVDLGLSKNQITADSLSAICTDHIFYGKGRHNFSLRLKKFDVEKTSPTLPYEQYRTDASHVAVITGASTHTWFFAIF